MSYFEPGRPRFERRRLGLSPLRLIEAVLRRSGQGRVAVAALLGLYVGGALLLCGMPALGSAALAILLAAILAMLLAGYAASRRPLSAICYALILALGIPALLVPGVAYTALAIWGALSLPVYLFRL
jgi:hypothetical protein